VNFRKGDIDMKQRIVLAIALMTGITAVPVDSLTESSMGRQVTVQRVRKVTVPEGTRIPIRTIDPLDPSKQRAGQLFGGILETNILVDDVIVATRETIVAIGIGRAAGAGVAAGTAVVSTATSGGELSIRPHL
jgi:hypothetical protein